MNQMKKRVASIALAGVMLFGSGFLADAGTAGFLPIKPVIAMAETTEFTINGISYELAGDDNVSVRGCRSMSTVNIPAEVECFGKKYKVVAIRESAFKNNDYVSSISIPESVKYIHEDTFIGCSNLKSITVSANNEDYSSSNGVLYNKSETILIKYPSAKIENNLTFSIPDDVETIHSRAFDKCNNLKTIIIPKSTSYISDFAFNNCRNLQEIKVDSNNSNFCSEYGILYTKDKTRLLKYPGALSYVTFTVPKSVNYIAENAFIDAINLNSINVASGNKSFKADSGVLFDYNKTKLISYPPGKDGKVYYVPSSVTQIGQYAFTNTAVTDLRNMDRRIYASYFMEYAYITHINGSSSLTSENAGFILSNLYCIQNSHFIINAVKAKINEAQNYMKNNYQRYKNLFPRATDEAIKARIMHDWLCQNVMYVPTAKDVYGERNYSAGDIPSQEEQSRYIYAAYIDSGVSFDSINGAYYVDNLSSYRYHSAVGALLMPFTVCEGYAKAYQLLLKSVSIDCEVVNDAKNTHVWNVVEIDGKYYSVDCTFDDEYGGINYNHFLKTHEYLNGMGSRYDNPKVLNLSDQEVLFKNALGISSYSPKSYDYIRANSATSNYSF